MTISNQRHSGLCSTTSSTEPHRRPLTPLQPNTSCLVRVVLPQRGQHRSAGAVDLVAAATVELQGLTLLHRDRDFECIAAVTGQVLQWYGP